MLRLSLTWMLFPGIGFLPIEGTAHVYKPALTVASTGQGPGQGSLNALASQGLITPSQLSWRRWKSIPYTLLVCEVPSEVTMFNGKKRKKERTKRQFAGAFDLRNFLSCQTWLLVIYFMLITKIFFQYKGVIFEMLPMLIFYCWITNYNKLSGLK